MPGKKIPSLAEVEINVHKRITIAVRQPAFVPAGTGNRHVSFGMHSDDFSRAANQLHGKLRCTGALVRHQLHETPTNIDFHDQRTHHGIDISKYRPQVSPDFWSGEEESQLR